MTQTYDIETASDQADALQAEVYRLERINAALLDALVNLRTRLWADIKLDVRKHFSLMVADAAAGTAIHEATS